MTLDPLVRGPKWSGKAWTGKIDLSKAALLNGCPTHWESEEQERVKGGNLPVKAFVKWFLSTLSSVQPFFNWNGDLEKGK